MGETPGRWFGGDRTDGWYAPVPGEEPAPQGRYEVNGSVIYFEPEEEETWVLRDASAALPPDTLNCLGLSADLQADLSDWLDRWSWTVSMTSRLRGDDWEDRGRRLFSEAAVLVSRVRAEIRAGYTVVLNLEPWPSLP